MSARQIEVPLASLDDFIPSEHKQRIRAIKLDLEGGEYDAMRGAQQILRAFRPLVLFEFGGTASASLYGFTREEFYGFFQSLDFNLMCVFGLPYEAEHWDLPREQHVGNYLAVPKELVATVRSMVKESAPFVFERLRQEGKF